MICDGEQHQARLDSPEYEGFCGGDPVQCRRTTCWGGGEASRYQEAVNDELLHERAKTTHAALR
jgi:hypothetical protein